MDSSNPYQPPPDSGQQGFSSGRSRVRIRRVGVSSLGVFLGAAGFAAGLFGAGFFGLISLVGLAAGENMVGPFESLLSVFLPILYGFMGFIAGVIYAVIFNAIASLTGGLEIELAAPRG